MRARDIGLFMASGRTGPLNAIVDVPGVAVGHATRIAGDGPLVVGEGPVRTGVTVVVPRPEPVALNPVFAGIHRLNGNGEMTGSHWIEESGLLTSPIALTNTHSVGVVRDALVQVERSHRSGSASAETLASIATAIEQGTPSFKVFTTDVTTGQAGIRIDHGSVLAAMRIAQEAGGIVMVHAEDDDLIKYNEARLRREGRNQLQNIRCAHTPFGEALAFRQVAALAAEAGAATYFVHITAGESVGVVAAERRRGRPVYAETLHNLLCFSEEDYLKPDGARYHIGMGLPSPDDRAQLWAGVTAGDIATVATDEYTTSLEVKLGGHDIETVPGGHVGIETRGTILLSEGYKRGRLSLRRFVELFATNPARIFGLYPRKGVIQPGADADLAIWDLDVKRMITMDDLHHDGDYSPWEGWKVSAWPVMTVLRGTPIVSDGKLQVGPDYGRWQPRSIDPEVLEHPIIT